jgi:4-hydroxy-2-oxoheptanedioate aldolase
MGNSNNHICIIPQIESVKGVENLDEIAAVEGVTGLMFGPGDFSADAGIEFRMDGEPYPTFVAAMTKMVTTAHKYGKPLFG